MSLSGRPSHRDLPAEAEVVVIGAGHNSLVCAGYLAAAGLEVLVLEASADAGGNTRTEELTLPGFAHDSCSSAHVLIQCNPLIRDDELGLRRPLRADVPHHRSRRGDAAGRRRHPGHATRPGRDVPTRWPLLPAGRRGAAADDDGVARRARGRARPLELRACPLGDDDGRRAATRPARAAVRGTSCTSSFEHPVVRDFVLWLAMATIQDPRRPGTGFLPSSLTAGRLSFGWTTPVGGSQALPDALVRLLEDHGGRVVCSAPVAPSQVEGDGVRGVRTSDGRQVRVAPGRRRRRPPRPARRDARGARRRRTTSCGRATPGGPD